MGTPLTGSTVASTYTSLLKTTDNAALTASLRTISDGNGNDSALQISSAGVASTGTLAVTGAASLSSLSTSGNITVGGNLVVTGTTTLSAGLSVPGTLSCTGNFSVNTNKFTVDATSGNASVLGTLGVTGATSLSSLSTSGAATVGTTLGVTGNFEVGAAKFTVAAASGNTAVAGTLDVAGNTTLSGDLAVNGNTTIGNASGDSLTVTAGTVAINNLPSKATPVNADTVIIRDSAASNAVKTATISAVSPVRFAYAYDIQTATTAGQTLSLTTGVGTAIQESGSDWIYTWTPKNIGNKAIIRVSIPVRMGITGYVYAGIVENPYSAPANVIAVGGVYSTAVSPVNVLVESVFTSSQSTHSFKIWLTGQTQTVVVAENPSGYYFGQIGTTYQAKVHFELIEFA
jgi:hypothetical protein